LDRETGARRLVARIRQSFGALLFTPASTGRSTMDYRRVAADGMNMVRFQDNVSLADILNNARILDVYCTWYPGRRGLSLGAVDVLNLCILQ
ncbi:hypothetical protein EV363DRAFT_1171621, partial [Boletus edulis]